MDIQSNNILVAIKERMKEEKDFLYVWKREVKMLKEIDHNLPNLITPRIIAVLKDTQRSLDSKYIVMEWIEGGSLKLFCKKNSKTKIFNTEKNFLRMFYLLLDQLYVLQKSNYIHRDIKLENIMYFKLPEHHLEEENKNGKKENFLFYCFIDFASLHNLENKKKKKLRVFSDHFSPPEQNTEKECFKSDLYSLSVSLLNFISLTKLTVGDEIVSLLNSMKEPEIDNRPSLGFCIDSLLFYCKKKYVKTNYLFDNYPPKKIFGFFTKDFQFLKESFLNYSPIVNRKHSFLSPPLPRFSQTEQEDSDLQNMSLDRKLLIFDDTPSVSQLLKENSILQKKLHESKEKIKELTMEIENMKNKK